MVLLACNQTFAQEVETEQLDEVVITESRFETPKKKASKVITLINSDEITRNQGKTLVQLLNEQIGLNINGSLSQAGQSLNTFIRGGQNRQVLVMINGLPVNDPSTIESNFDLQLLALDQIESVEIIRGASSALFGNRASTAVINIQLKRPQAKDWTLNLGSTIGTNNDQEDSAVGVESITNFINIGKGGKDFGLTAMFSNSYVDGLSAVRPLPDEDENQSDIFSRVNATVSAYAKPTEKLKLEFIGNYSDYNTDYDNGFGFTDGNNSAGNEQFRLGLKSSFKYKNGELVLNTAFNNSKREFDSDFPANFKSNDLAFDLFNRNRLSENLRLLSGLSFNRNSMDSETIPFGAAEFSPEIESENANQSNFDPYFNLSYSNKGFRANGGLRLNINSEYGSALVYNVNPSYTIELGKSNLKILSSLSSAYITPSLFQLFAPGFGNTELDPQRDMSFELGTVLYVADKLEISTQYFRREQEDQIDFVIVDFETFEGEYQNLQGLRKVQGVEVGLNSEIGEKINFNSNYSFTESLDGPIFRIPKHKLNASLQYRINTKGSVSLAYQYNSSRVSPFLNEDFTENIVLDEFSLVNLNASYSIIKDKLTLNAGIFNLFNEDYEELYRFSTRGRNFQFGFRLRI